MIEKSQKKHGMKLRKLKALNSMAQLPRRIKYELDRENPQAQNHIVEGRAGCTSENRRAAHEQRDELAFMAQNEDLTKCTAGKIGGRKSSP
jgi:hypothetical protein